MIDQVGQKDRYAETVHLSTSSRLILIQLLHQVQHDVPKRLHLYLPSPLNALFIHIFGTLTQVNVFFGSTLQLQVQ